MNLDDSLKQTVGKLLNFYVILVIEMAVHSENRDKIIYFMFGHRVLVVLMHHYLFRLERERLMERGKFNLYGIDDGT